MPQCAAAWLNRRRTLMKIGELAAATGLTVDTLRFYEKSLVLEPPAREGNGYRRYNARHLERVRFIQSARALGFSLAEIGEILPRLSAGQFGRSEIEVQLFAKLREVRAEIDKLKALERNIVDTFGLLTCDVGAPVSTIAATLDEPGRPMLIRPLRRAQHADIA
jgi:DNA-binding transcriptional MerR regulator